MSKNSLFDTFSVALMKLGGEEATTKFTSNEHHGCLATDLQYNGKQHLVIKKKVTKKKMPKPIAIHFI